MVCIEFLGYPAAVPGVMFIEFGNIYERLTSVSKHGRGDEMILHKSMSVGVLALVETPAFEDGGLDFLDPLNNHRAACFALHSLRNLHLIMVSSKSAYFLLNIIETRQEVRQDEKATYSLHRH